MRRISLVLLVGYGAWAQQPAAKAPQKADAQLTRSSLSVSGLRNEKVLLNLFIGNFMDIPFGRSNLAFVSLFQDYLESYGRHCDRYLPPNKIELTRSVCSVQETRIDRYGTRVTTGNCLSYTTEGMGIFADPELYSAKAKLDDAAGPSMIQDAFQTMKQANPLGAALNTLNETQTMAGDMDALFRNNSCVSPGVRRFQENMLMFAMGKQPIVLPGTETSTPKPKTAAAGPFKDQNYSRLLEDLILDQSRSWLMNRFVSGSTSNVVVSSRDSAGRPSKIVGQYLFNGRSQGSATLSFSDGVPQCLYFFDFPSTCKTASSTIAAAYSRGAYEPGGVPRVNTANPAPPPAPSRPVQPAAPVRPPATASSVPVSPATVSPAPTTPAVVSSTPVAAPAPTPAERREKAIVDNQVRIEKVNACAATFQKALKEHPDGGAALNKEYLACVQAAVQPPASRAQ